MVKKHFVLHEKVIVILQNKFYITTIYFFRFVQVVYGFLVQWNVGRLEIIFPKSITENMFEAKETLCYKKHRKTAIEIQNQQQVKNRKLSM